MITIEMPEWVMWLIVAFLFVNAATVGYDTIVRLRIYKLLAKLKDD